MGSFDPVHYVEVVHRPRTLRELVVSLWRPPMAEVFVQGADERISINLDNRTLTVRVIDTSTEDEADHIYPLSEVLTITTRYSAF